jgi:SAM-dependent methyltransferase
MQRIGPVHRHIREDLVRRVLALNVSSILDVGCGSGENLAALDASGVFELTGVDISREGIELARRRTPKARFELLDIEHAALPERFDFVMSIQVLEHLQDDVSALRNMAAMSHRYVFISTIGGRMRRSEPGTGHVRNYTRADLAAKLEAAGLRLLEVSGWGFPFYSPLYRSSVEWVPGGPPAGAAGRVSRIAANVLYELYRLNWPGRGDVLSALAETPSSIRQRT